MRELAGAAIGQPCIRGERGPATQLGSHSPRQAAPPVPRIRHGAYECPALMIAPRSAIDPTPSPTKPSRSSDALKHSRFAALTRSEAHSFTVRCSVYVAYPWAGAVETGGTGPIRSLMVGRQMRLRGAAWLEFRWTT